MMIFSCSIVPKSMPSVRFADIKKYSRYILLIIIIIFLPKISLLKFDCCRITSMLHFSSLDCLKKIFPLMSKWYHNFVGTLQRCLFVINSLDLTTKIGF